MSRVGHLRLAIALSFGLCALPCVAQAAGNLAGADEPSPAVSPSTNLAAETPAPQNPDPTQQPQYAPALDGGLIPLDSLRHLHLLFGGSVSAGWDGNPQNLASGDSSGVYSASPYIGLQGSSARTQFVLQYQPSITRYTDYAAQQMQTVSGTVTGSVNPRSSWTVSATGNHGEDSVRLLGPAQSIAVGGIAVTGPNSATYLPNAGTITNIDGGLNFHYDASPRDGVDFKIGNSFSSIPSLGESSSLSTASVSYTHRIIPALSILGYGQSSQYYLGLRCSTFGGGGGFTWQPSRGTFLALKGGPQLNTPDCHTQQGFAYNTSIATRISGRSQIFFLADRQPLTGYLGSGLWQDDVSGGYHRQLALFDSLSFSAGYLTSSTLKKIGSYSGTYFDSSYTHSLRRGVAFVLSYRSYTGTSNGTSFSRNVALAALSWTSNPRQPAQ